jgi:beta-glucanase (GH16 family)
MKKRIILLLLITNFLISCKTEEDIKPIVVPITMSCTDGIQNGDETGIDCGGSSCNSCKSSGPIIPASGYTSPKSYTGYNLVWVDDFTSELDTNKWSFHIGSGCPSLCGWGNNELQNYTNRNHSFVDGNLVIEAKKENTGSSAYTSTRIHTDNKFEIKYGRIDIRANMPSATGSWVAFWLINKDYSVNDPADKWPSGGEIDIMEYLGESQNKVFGTTHFGEDLSKHQYKSTYYTATGENFDKVYYVFSIIWKENKITWLINNEEYKTFTPSDTNGQPYPFNDEFYLILNLSVGGNLPVAPVASEYQAYLIVDYIKVFEKN